MGGRSHRRGVRRSSAQPENKEVEAQLTELESLSYQGLQEEWLRWYQVPPPARVSRKLLLLGVGWKIQERAFGGLSAATKRRLTTIAKSLKQGEGVPANRAAQLKPGTRLVREWHGQMYTVTVVEEGLEWRDQVWRSLSVIAREITGQRWSGPRFFGLRSPRRDRLSNEPTERR